MTAPYRQLRDAIEQIVGADLGYYQIGTGQAPALMVTPPEPSARWKPVGLEVVICREPEITNHAHLGGNRRSYQWVVILNQWTRSDYQTLTTVRDRIQDNFIQSTSTYQEQSALTYERCNIYIPVSKYLRTTCPNP